MQSIPLQPHVALLIETSQGSGRDILRGIARYVGAQGPWAFHHEPQELTRAFPRWLRKWRGDGIIARIKTPKMAEQLLASGIPVVDVLGTVPGSPFPLVQVDNQAVARMAGEHLIDRGLMSFAYVGIQGETWSEQRYAGLRAAVGSIQRDVPLYEFPRPALHLRYSERLEIHLARWIRKLPRPAGVMVGSDRLGPLFLKACRRAGVSVPDELAVIGVDNDEPLCEMCAPPLSSVDAGHFSVGHEAAALLHSLMRGAKPPNSPRFLPPRQVIARLSTDMLAIDDPALADALRLIHLHAHQGLKVNAIARAVGLSRSVLQRRFRLSLKRTVHQDILRARIRRARELLTITDLPLSAIAERAGFRHQEYMGAVFKARLGRTPGAIRNGALRGSIR